MRFPKPSLVARKKMIARISDPAEFRLDADETGEDRAPSPRRRTSVMDGRENRAEQQRAGAQRDQASSACSAPARSTRASASAAIGAAHVSQAPPVWCVAGAAARSPLRQ